MPITPENRWLYPIDWRELSRLIRFVRAAGACERCGRPHGQVVTHLEDGIWWDTSRDVWRDGRGKRVRRLPPPWSLEAMQPWLVDLDLGSWLPTTQVVLATAHLDHNPGNSRLRNLAALCQRCHMLHDAPEHRRTRWHRAFHRRAAGDLFEERGRFR